MSRKKVTINGKRVYRSHAVWNEAHPDDPVLPGEVIHHKDEDKENDVPGNLEKMLDFGHRSLHSAAAKGNDALSRWRQEFPETAHATSVENARQLQHRMQTDHDFAEGVKARRRPGTIRANKARALDPEERRRRRNAYMRKYRAKKREEK